MAFIKTKVSDETLQRLYISPKGTDIKQVITRYYQTPKRAFENKLLRQLNCFVFDGIVKRPLAFLHLKLSLPALLDHSGCQFVPLESPDVFLSYAVPRSKLVAWW